MPPGVFVLVLFVAVLHVLWNAILKSSGDTLRTAARAMVVGVAVFAPAVVAAWLATGRPGLTGDVLGLALISGVLEAAYFVTLSAAYQHGDLSVVYPIARGTAPVVAVMLGVVVLGERLSPLGTVGVAALLAGIVLVQRPWRAVAAIAAVGRRARGRNAPGAGPGIAPGVGPGIAPGAAEFALLTGVTIAAYSAVDRTAVQHVAPWLYAGVVFPICAVVLVAWVRLVADRRRSSATAAAPPAAGTPALAPASWLRSGIAGTVSLGAYGLILVAYTLAPLTAVAPLRESSVVIASAWGAIRMREAVSSVDRARRIGGACLVLIGAVLLALDP
ncbi:MAG: EamA family transporter [Candidatus Limnocylindrales bacterium]